MSQNRPEGHQKTIRIYQTLDANGDNIELQPVQTGYGRATAYDSVTLA
jgi:hypothetical protein